MAKTKNKTKKVFARNSGLFSDESVAKTTKKGYCQGMRISVFSKLCARTQNLENAHTHKYAAHRHILADISLLIMKIQYYVMQ